MDQDEVVELLKRWTLEYGVLGTLRLVERALREKHEGYRPMPVSSFSAYADAISQTIPEVEARYRAIMAEAGRE